MKQEEQKEVRRHLTNLSEWTESEVNEFAKKWMNAKQDIDEEVWKIVQRGIDIVLKYFKDRVDPLPELSEGVSCD